MDNKRHSYYEDETKYTSCKVSFNDGNILIYKFLATIVLRQDRCGPQQCPRSTQHCAQNVPLHINLTKIKTLVLTTGQNNHRIQLNLEKYRQTIDNNDVGRMLYSHLIYYTVIVKNYSNILGRYFAILIIPYINMIVELCSTNKLNNQDASKLSSFRCHTLNFLPATLN